MVKNHEHIQGVPKKRGISECYSVSFTALMIWSLDYSLVTHLKIDIHRLVPNTNTKPFLGDIRELRNLLYVLVSLKNIVMMEDDWELVSS